MGIGYQDVDRKVIDYDIWFADAGRVGFRGPRFDLEARNAICCIGAAQTFGRFVHQPFAELLRIITGRPVWNLGFSGAGPEYFLNSPFLMKQIEKAETVILQSLSARSVSAGLFRTTSNNGVLEFVDGPLKDKRFLAQDAYRQLKIKYGEAAYHEQIRVVQEIWVKLNSQLISHVKGKKIYLWLSKCKPGDNITLEKSSVGEFPHFVSAEMVTAVAKLCDVYVDATLETMPAQVLRDDHTGEVFDVFDKERFPARSDHLRAINNYYATPPIHELAASLLVPHFIGK